MPLQLAREYIISSAEGESRIALTLVVGLFACWIIGSTILPIGLRVSVETAYGALGAARSEVSLPIKNNYAKKRPK